MTLNARLLSVLDWLREGYPAGVPPKVEGRLVSHHGWPLEE